MTAEIGALMHPSKARVRTALDAAKHAQSHGTNPVANDIVDALGIPRHMPVDDVAAAVKLAQAIPAALTARLIVQASAVLAEAGPHRSPALDGLALTFAAIDVARVAGAIAELDPTFPQEFAEHEPETDTATVLTFPVARRAWPYGGDE